MVVGKFPFSAIGKAKILGETGGFTKIVTDKRYDEVLGIHIIGPHATELISEATAALNLEATAESLFEAVHAHPTLSEAMGEAADLLEHDRFEDLFGTPLGSDVLALAAAHGVPTALATTAEELHVTLDAPGPIVVRVPSDRAANVRVHADLHAAVAAALG